MEIVRDIAAVLACIISLFSVITLLTKSGRGVITNFFQKNTRELIESNKKQSEDIEKIQSTLDTVSKKVGDLEEVSKQQCRDVIKNIYYKYRQKKIIPLYERKAADFIYDIYSKVYHGNSYATLLYTEIRKWEIEVSNNDFDAET